MKRLFTGVAALALGVALTFGASAFRAESNSVVSSDWFATDRSGNLIQPYQTIDEEALCLGGDDFCAKEYNVVNGVPTTPTSTPAAMRPK